MHLQKYMTAFRHTVLGDDSIVRDLINVHRVCRALWPLHARLLVRGFARLIIGLPHRVMLWLPWFQRSRRHSGRVQVLPSLLAYVSLSYSSEVTAKEPWPFCLLVSLTLRQSRKPILFFPQANERSGGKREGKNTSSSMYRFLFRDGM